MSTTARRPDPVPAEGLLVRPAEPGETGAIVELAGRALGWSDDPRHRRLFEWKHQENPAGPSPMWVAEEAGALVGFRAFLRWRWTGPSGPVAAVRAVDTATAPEHQGRGVFRRLTTAALPHLAEEGVGFVFNTPNERSRPGYVAMGWRVLGRPVVAVRVARTGWRRLPSARAPAEKWSTATDVGEPAAAFFADGGATARLLALRPAPSGLATDVDPAFLRWRYGLPDLHYRALPAGDRVEDGAVIFRLRRRGEALEATVCAVPGLEGRGRRLGALLADLLARTGADYALGTRADLPAGAALPAPRQGPVLTWREVTPRPPARLGDLALSLGDLELF